MHKKFVWYLLTLLFCVSLATNAQISIEGSVKMYECADPKLGINEIIKDKYASEFCRPGDCIYEAEPECVYWVYFEVENKDNLPLVIDAEIFYYNLTAYFFDENMVFIDSLRSGYNVNLSRKPIATPTNSLPMPNGKKFKCYIRFNTYIKMGLYFQVHSFPDFVNLKLKQFILSGLVNGVFLLAIIYSALFALLLWRRIYIYYMFYVVSFWIFMVSINHETSLYFSWLNLPFSAAYYIIPHYILTISLLLYTRELLQLKYTLPVFSKIIWAVIGFISSLFLIYLVTGWVLYDNVINKIALFPSYVASVILISRRYKAAWFVFFGITLIYIAFLSIYLDLKVPLFFTFSVYGVMEIILFGISITYWLKSLVVEKEKALQLALSSASEISSIKQNQNIILEKEVAIKTQELKEANEQLEIYLKQVEDLNQNLEKDNVNLKVKVTDQLKARSEDKLMSFEEFKLNFPLEEDCYKHIENIKWSNGFVCYKCGNDRFAYRNVLNSKPARRCTKCNYINTIPSYTLFHNVKFPIQKAFYITYVVGTKKPKTLDELSKELDLRVGTIHSFLKRAKEASSLLNSGKKHLDGWSHIIMYYPKDEG